MGAGAGALCAGAGGASCWPPPCLRSVSSRVSAFCGGCTGCDVPDSSRIERGAALRWDMIASVKLVVKNIAARIAVARVKAALKLLCGVMNQPLAGAVFRGRTLATGVMV